jgi:hypothetical protein
MIFIDAGEKGFMLMDGFEDFTERDNNYAIYQTFSLINNSRIKFCMLNNITYKFK